MTRSATKALRYFLLLGPLAALGACGSENPGGGPAPTPGTDAEVETSTDGDPADTGSGDALGDGGADSGAEVGTGKEGEACRADGTCEPSNRCDSFTFRCVHCDPGSLGCDCGVGGACGAGLSCYKAHCLDGSSVPPKSPVCYTPCSASLSDATGTRVCDSDGLLEGCLAGRSCVNGSCLLPTETATVCKTDLECPFFQRCLDGGCYSNCVANSDCAPGLVCSQKACRPPCTIGGAACPTGSVCSTKDGSSGSCKIQAPLPAKPGPLPAGDYALSTGNIGLTNTIPTGKFAIQAKTGSTYDQKFVVRKLWHRVYRPGKPVEDVQAQLDPVTKAYKTCSPSKPAECVMPWLEVSTGATKTTGDTVNVTALSGCTGTCPEITVNVPKGSIDASRWEGELAIEGPNGTKYVRVDYATRPEGQFSGEMYYFGTFNDEGLQDFLDGKTTDIPKNALLKTWYAFRGKGGTLMGGREELEAVFNSTRTGSWNFKETKDRCKTYVSVPVGQTAACYPFTTSTGIRQYVSDIATYPVPTGVSELPIALNLKMDPTNTAVFKGRIESTATLHYPGNPVVSLKFSGDPTAAAACSGTVTDACAVFLAQLPTTDTTSNVVRLAIGGRTLLTQSGATCPTGTSSRFDFPWLVPGFLDGTAAGSPTRTRGECRSTNLPFDALSAADPADENSNLAGGSPVPDGITRERKLEFFDGALIDQNDIILMFRESFGGFVDNTKQVYAYGYARLKRSQAALTDPDYVGTAPKTVPVVTSAIGGATCDPTLYSTYLASKTTDDERVQLLIKGSAATGTNVIPVTITSPVKVHYLCGDTGLFDGGADAALRVACPAGSNVTYFTLPSSTIVTGESCQTVDSVTKRGTCDAKLKAWIDAGVAKTAVGYTCTDTSQQYCDSNLADRTVGKSFFIPATGVTAPLNSLQSAIDDAFRYKTKFRSSVGATPGFAPSICMATGYDLTPYCYDPAQIEQTRKRVDCLLSYYRNEHTVGATRKLSDTARNDVDLFLRKSFSKYKQTLPTGTDVYYDGFERLYGELMVVLGDEALTAAYASRFDLAGASSSTFPGFNDGDKRKGFEKNGIDLTGVPGAEMVQLHRAVQYYQLALDRLYEHGPDFKASLAGNIDLDASFVSPSTVTDYLERLIRAASQKSRAWSEIAKRYQQFRRPDLARRVLKRAYVSTHLEGALLDSLMLEIMKRSPVETRPAVRLAIETAQLTFRMSLLTMRENFAAITDDQTFFGYAPDYVPFPVVDGSSNAFKVLLASASSKTSTAFERENTALSSNRTGRIETAKFNSELVNIRTTYENQLADICGTFSGDDGIVYPAISKYAGQSTKASLFGDPCGMLGNGGIHNARADIRTQQNNLTALKLKMDHLFQEKANEETRVRDQCAAITKLADLQLSTSTGIIDLQAQAASTAADIHLATSLLQTLVSAADVSNCELTGCPAAIAKGVAIAAAGAATSSLTYVMEKKVAERQKEIALKELGVTVASTTLGCDLARIDSIAKVKSIVMAIDELDLEILQTVLNALTAQANLEAKQNESRRLQTLQTQAEQLIINVESAENDPNVRIYQNDAVINADFSFNDAMSAAYRLTRVYEYYTGQSYKKKEQLFLIRMVAAGTYNLQNYLTELENAFSSYEETYGSPSLRVLKLSLMDDILKIPTIDKAGKPMDEGLRKDMLHSMLLEPARVDGNGYLVLPFATSIRSLSPLTRTHKIQRVEANINLGTAGDNIARVYVRATGTGTVRNLAGDTDYYLFPKRTAVINPKINSALTYDPEVYRNYSFRDRPLANSMWELVINQKDEIANRDMDLQSLTDIELFFYYTDVTAL